MTRSGWRGSSITWYFALAFGIAMTAGIALFHMLNALVPIEHENDEPYILGTFQADAIAGVVRMVDAAPTGVRATLAEAASGRGLQVKWLKTGTPVATRETKPGSRERAEIVQSRLDSGTGSVVFVDGSIAVDGTQADHSNSPQSKSEPYSSIAVSLRDGSGLIFTAADRGSGAGPLGRFAARFVILSVVISLVACLGARLLARPLDAFAVAARRFGTDPKAPPIVEQGPREMRQAIAAFNTMQLQIQRFVSGQVAMFSAISHDLRTPLTRMRLRGEFIVDSQQQERLFRDVDDMQSMIDAALAYLRDNAADEETTSIDLPELLRTIADNYADMGNEVAYSGPDHLPYRGRPVALKRAFGNLVDNAVRYGRLAAIELRKGQGSVVVTVCDEGPGIPVNALEEVFTPFQRVDPSRNRHTGGIGLGLTAARAGFRAHGGDVILANGVDRGLRASVTLPMTR